MAEYAIVKWVTAHWRTLALGAFLLSLTGWHFQDKISDWWDARKIERLEAKVEAVTTERDTARKDADTGDKTADAAKGARTQNDAAIPKIRAATAERVNRVDPDADRMSGDDAGALADYEAAAGRLRGASAR